MKLLQSDEVCLEGKWIELDGKIGDDLTSKRIQELLVGSLTKVAESNAGWTCLYLDKRDDRYWELTYPHADWPGGGPPVLTKVVLEEVQPNYKIDNNKGRFSVFGE